MICDLFFLFVIVIRRKRNWLRIDKIKMKNIMLNDMIRDERRAVLLTLLFVLVQQWIEIGHSTCVFERMDKQKKKTIERFTLTLTFAVLLHLLLKRQLILLIFENKNFLFSYLKEEIDWLNIIRLPDVATMMIIVVLLISMPLFLYRNWTRLVSNYSVSIRFFHMPVCWL